MLQPIFIVKLLMKFVTEGTCIKLIITLKLYNNTLIYPKLLECYYGVGTL
jgi:hypothetical protein